MAIRSAYSNCLYTPATSQTTKENADRTYPQWVHRGRQSVLKCIPDGKRNAEQSSGRMLIWFSTWQPLMTPAFQTDSEDDDEAKEHPQSRSPTPVQASTPMEHDPSPSPSQEADQLPSDSRPHSVPRSRAVSHSDSPTSTPAKQAQDHSTASSEVVIPASEGQERSLHASQPPLPIAPAPAIPPVSVHAPPGPSPPQHPPIASLSTLFNPYHTSPNVQSSVQGTGDDEAPSAKHLKADPDDVQPVSPQNKRPLDLGAGGNDGSHDAVAQEHTAPPQKRLKADPEVSMDGESLAEPAQRGKGRGPARGNGRGRGKNTSSKRVQEENVPARGRGQGVVRGTGRKGKARVAIDAQEQGEQGGQEEGVTASPIQVKRVTRRVAAAAAKASAEAAAKPQNLEVCESINLLVH